MDRAQGVRRVLVRPQVFWSVQSARALCGKELIQYFSVNGLLKSAQTHIRTQRNVCVRHRHWPSIITHTYVNETHTAHTSSMISQSAAASEHFVVVTFSLCRYFSIVGSVQAFWSEIIRFKNSEKLTKKEKISFSNRFCRVLNFEWSSIERVNSSKFQFFVSIDLENQFNCDSAGI